LPNDELLTFDGVSVVSLVFAPVRARSLWVVKMPA
jgi:hypothetical protein